MNPPPEMIFDPAKTVQRIHWLGMIHGVHDPQKSRKSTGLNILEQEMSEMQCSWQMEAKKTGFLKLYIATPPLCSFVSGLRHSGAFWPSYFIAHNAYCAHFLPLPSSILGVIHIHVTVHVRVLPPKWCTWCSSSAVAFCIQSSKFSYQIQKPTMSCFVSASQKAFTEALPCWRDD